MPEYTGEEAFFPSSVYQPATRESGGIQSAETACGDNQGEDEGADAAKNDGTEMDSYGVRGRDDGGGEDEDVGDGGGEVGDDDEWHGRVYDSGEVSVWMKEFANNVISIIPAIKCPQASVQGNSPTRGISACAVEPASGFPVRIWGAFPREAGDCDNYACHSDCQQRNEFEEHENVTHPCSQLSGDAVEQGDTDQTGQCDAFVDPSAHILGVCSHDSANDVFAKDDGDDGR